MTGRQRIFGFWFASICSIVLVDHLGIANAEHIIELIVTGVLVVLLLIGLVMMAAPRTWVEVTHD